MSQEKFERRPREGKQPGKPTEDLERKAMHVGSSLYHIEMKQNGESRFMRIVEDPDSTRRTRVIVPMCCASEIIKKLRDAYTFCSTYSPKNVSVRKTSDGRPESPNSATHITNGGRRYYFDVIDADESVKLRISYVFGRRRETIHIVAQALPNLIELLEKYQSNYPSVSPTDDYPLPNNRFNPRRTFNDRRFNYYRNRNFRPRAPYNGESATGGESESRRPSVALKVVSDPAPTSISSNAKSFTVEIVEGQNTFFRITEMINESRKSTLHVPVEICSQLHVTLSEMFKKYHQKASTGAPTANSKA